MPTVPPAPSPRGPRRPAAPPPRAGRRPPALLAALVLTLSVPDLAAQYPPVAPELGQDRRVDSDPPGSASSVEPRVVATADGALHVVWLDHRDGRWGVWYRRVIDLDVGSALPEVELSAFVNQPNLLLNPADPALATDGDAHLYVAWRAASPQQEALLFVRSDDGGLSWSAPALASPSLLNAGMVTEYAGPPSLAADAAGHVHVAWAQSDGVFDQVYLVSSDDHGASFDVPQLNQPVNLVTTGHSEAPVVASDGDGGVFVAWLDHRDPETRDVWLRRSTDFGATLEPGELRLSPHSTATELELVAQGGGPDERLVLAAWLDLRQNALGLPETRVLARWSSDGGTTFVEPAAAVHPTCAQEAWHDLVGGPATSGRSLAGTGDCAAMHLDLELAANGDGDVWAAWSAVEHPLLDRPSVVHTRRFRRDGLLWDPPRPLGRAGARFPARGLLPSLPRVAVAAVGERAFAAWMLHGPEHTTYAEVVTAWTTDGGASWSAPSLVTRKAAGPGTSRSGHPSLVALPDGAGLVWDDRRHHTVPDGQPVPPGSPAGHPDVFFAEITLPSIAGGR